MDIPPILVINLEERKDRWVSIQNAFQSWRVPLQRVEAVRMKPGWKGCSLSHKKCIQIAKDRKYPWVLIVEDDCKPEDDAQERFRALLPSLWARRSEWDLFNGGSSYLFSARVIQEEPPLLEVSGWATQFILIHEGSYDHLATQATGVSDIENKEIDYSAQFKKSEEILFTKIFLYKWDYIPKTVATVLIVGSILGLALRFSGRSRFIR